MINFATLKKKETPSLLINKPLLLTFGGQSNIMPQDANGATWAQNNHPEIFGLKENIYIHPNQDTSTNIIQQMNVGTNWCQTAVGINAQVVTVVKLQEYTKQPIHCSFWGRGGTPIYWDGITDQVYTWNISKPFGNYGLYLNLCYKTDQMVTEMNSLYGAGNWVHLAFKWMQGEEDNGYQASLLAYEVNEYNLFNDFRNKYGNGVRFLSGGIWHDYSAWDNYQPNTGVNLRKRNNEAKSEYYKYMYQSDLTLSDVVHFDAPSQWEIGIRDFDYLKQFVKQN